jgi:hypothetical protein
VLEKDVVKHELMSFLSCPFDNVVKEINDLHNMEEFAEIHDIRKWTPTGIKDFYASYKL